MKENNALAEINSLEDATLAWEIFFNRFYSAEVPKDASVEFDPKQREFIPRKNEKAKDERFSWNDETNMPYYSSTDGRTYHSDDFDDFLNGNTVTIPKTVSLNQKGLNHLEKAIQTGNYTDDAFKDNDHIFYTLWLFKQNKITRQQMTTLLARNQFPEPYTIIKTFNIIDNKGQFTPEAKEWLIPILKKNSFGKFTDWHLQRFRLLVQASPKSEQIFYLSRYNPQIITPSHVEKKQLGDALKRLGAWPSIKHKGKPYDIHLSFGALEARQIAIAGIHGAAANRAKIGKINIDSIRKGVKYFYRPTAISINNSGVAATTKGIHEFPYSPMPAVTGHDVFHSRVHNTIPPEFHMLCNHMIQIISEHTNQEWSKTIWELVDREFPGFAEKKVDLGSPKEGAELFSYMMQVLDNHARSFHKPHLFFHGDDSELNDEGIALIWNMVNEAKLWKKLYKIDIDKIGDPYQSHIKQMKAFVNQVGNIHAPPEMINLKYRFFCSTSNSKMEYPIINKILDSLQNTLIATHDGKLVFGKHTSNLHYFKNQTVLKFRNFIHKRDLAINKQSVRILLPTLIYYYLSDQFGSIGTTSIQQKVEAIALEFKSNHQGSNFSKELLDKSTDSLASLSDKLLFLETCYEKVLNSNYSRRYALVDRLFSFMKNPLSTSQRTHIMLLKTKMNEIIDAYKSQHASKQEEQEFQWLMENRGSTLARCSTTRFYPNVHSLSAEKTIVNLPNLPRP